MSNNSVFARTDEIVIKFIIKNDNNTKKIEFLEKNSEEQDFFEMVFKYPNWHDELYIKDKSMEIQDGIVSINAVLTRYRRFNRLLIRWNLKDEDSNVITMNEENFQKLDPDIVDKIIDKLDSFLSS